MEDSGLVAHGDLVSLHLLRVALVRSGCEV